MYQLDVSGIKNTPGEVLPLDVAVRMNNLQTDHGELSFNRPLRLKASLANEGGTLRLTGLLEGTAGIACGRCLDLFELPVKAEMDEVYYNEAQQDLVPGEEWVPFRGDRLDITPELVKAILSNLPMKMLCREGCRGLCPKCGNNLNRTGCGCPTEEIDPRLEVLRRFLEKQDR